MTPTEACALLKRHRDMWPEWIVTPPPISIETCPADRAVLTARSVVAVDDTRVLVATEAGPVHVDVGGKGWPGGAKIARVRPGLSDEENVLRILAAAEKGYRQSQRQRQAEKGAGR